MFRSQELLIGEKYNRLTVLGNFEYRPEGKAGKRRLWCEFLCDCGTPKFLRWKDVRSGKIQSCGCLVTERNPRQWTKAKSPQERTYKYLYKRYKTNAQQRSIEFLTYNVWRRVVINDCFFCGASPPTQNCYNEPNIRRKWKGPESEIADYDAPANGVDRYMPEKSYSGNSVACCKTCNVMKGQLTPEEFLDHINKIIRRTDAGVSVSMLNEQYFEINQDTVREDFAGRKVQQLNDEGEVIQQWDSVKE